MHEKDPGKDPALLVESETTNGLDPPAALPVPRLGLEPTVERPRKARAAPRRAPKDGARTRPDSDRLDTRIVQTSTPGGPRNESDNSSQNDARGIPRINRHNPALDDMG
jgi:hypothetical protein